MRWLRANASRFGLDGEHIGAWGDSAGGYLAALLGVTGDRSEIEGSSGTPGVSSRVQAVCDWFGPPDLMALAKTEPGLDSPDSVLSSLIGGAPSRCPDAAAAASPVTYASAKSVPFLIMHGDLDEAVPLSQSVLLYEALWRAGAEVRLHVVHGGAHLAFKRRPTDLPWHSAEVDALVDAFFYRHLMCAGS